MSPDGQHFLSGDDLRINLWNLEISKECFSMFLSNFFLTMTAVIDTKPVNMNELSEVLTCTEFHPSDPHTFMYSSSKGCVYVADMRKNALCDKTVRGELFLDGRL